MNVQQLHASTQVLQPFSGKPELSGYTFNFKHPLVVNLFILLGQTKTFYVLLKSFQFVFLGLLSV